MSAASTSGGPPTHKGNQPVGANPERVTRLIRRLEQLSCDKRLRQLGLRSSLECSVGWRDQTDGAAPISAMPKSDARVETNVSVMDNWNFILEHIYGRRVHGNSCFSYNFGAALCTKYL